MNKEKLICCILLTFQCSHVQRSNQWNPLNAFHCILRDKNSNFSHIRKLSLTWKKVIYCYRRSWKQDPKKFVFIIQAYAYLSDSTLNKSVFLSTHCAAAKKLWAVVFRGCALDYFLTSWLPHRYKLTILFCVFSFQLLNVNELGSLTA